MIQNLISPQGHLLLGPVRMLLADQTWSVESLVWFTMTRLPRECGNSRLKRSS